MNSQSNIPAADSADRILRRPELRATVGLPDSAIDREIREGRFPRPVNLIPGGRTVGWSWLEVQRWIADRKAASEATRGAA